jgi:hypothetical protein
VAWPEPSLPLESDGESADGEPDDEDEPPVAALPDDDESVVDGLELDAACAAMLAASVPAMLAATSPAVIAVVRRRPVSRSMSGPPLC